MSVLVIFMDKKSKSSQGLGSVQLDHTKGAISMLLADDVVLLALLDHYLHFAHGWFTRSWFLYSKRWNTLRGKHLPQRESIISFELSSCRVLLSGTCSLILLFNQTVQCFYWGPWGLLLVLGRRWFEFAQRRMSNTVNQNVFCLSIRRIVTTRMRSFSHNSQKTSFWTTNVPPCFHDSNLKELSGRLFLYIDFHIYLFVHL